MSRDRILLTGGSGVLGRELRELLPEASAPPSSELDLTRPETLGAAIEHHRPTVVIHAAAYTDVTAAERERRRCWQVNVEGTRNLVRAVGDREIHFIQISTDYVFEGTRGRYREDDPPGPVRNYYALSKLVAEEIARLAPRHLVLRTSFRPRQWPYPVAFTDVHTSQDYVDVIAAEVALAVERWRDIPFETLHIATERKTAYELARRRRPDVRPGTRTEAAVELPEDISLDTGRWQGLKSEWAGRQASPVEP